MSSVTNVILTWPLCADAESVLKDINDGCGYLQFVKDCCSGGSKHLEQNIAVGAINYLNLEQFIEHLKSISWEEPESVRLFVCGQEDEFFSAVSLK